MSTELKDWTRDWRNKNPEFRYELLSSESANTYVDDHFRGRADIFSTFHRLDDAILRADLIRYLTLLAEGGVYSDIDTECTRPVRSWIPAELRNQTNVLLGIEYDARGGEVREDIMMPIHICQWTMMAKPNHPVFNHVVDRVVAELQELGAGSDLIRAKSRGDVLKTTGPRIFTLSVVEALATQLDQNITLNDFAFIDSPKLFGDVLIMPVSAFGSGQDHSESKPYGNDEQLIAHHFRGWHGWVSKHTWDVEHQGGPFGSGS